MKPAPTTQRFAASLLLLALALFAAAPAWSQPTGFPPSPHASHDWCHVLTPPDSLDASTDPNWTLGTKKVLFYRLRFPGETSDLLTASQIEGAMQIANAAFERISYNKFDLEWTITPPLMLPHSREWYGPTGHATLASDAQAAALAAGINWVTFDFDIFLHRPLPGTYYSGLGTIGGRGVWLVYEGSPETYPHLVVHELGHNLGLPHANVHWTGNPHLSHPGADLFGLYGSPPFPSNVGAYTNITRFEPNSSAGQPDLRTSSLSIEYGDPFDIMGFDDLQRGFNAAYRRRLLWLTESNIVTVTNSGVFRLHAVDAGQVVPRRAYALRIERPLSGRSPDALPRHYWLQHHGARATNVNLADGIQLRWEPDATYASSQYVDASPANLNITKPESRLLPLGRTFTDSLANLHLTPLAAVGEGEQRYVDIEVRMDSPLSNRAPSLTLSASTSNAVAGELVTFTATATDPDGEPLHFFWDFGDGTRTNGTNVIRHAFGESSAGAVVRCEASDGQGGVASRHWFIGVGAQASGRIVGRVLDTQGRPIPNARVHNGRLHSFPFDLPEFVNTETDSLGTFTLVCPDEQPNLPGAFAYGYRVVSPEPGLAIAVRSGASTNLDFVLGPLPTLRTEFVPAVAPEGASNVLLSFIRTGAIDQPLEVWFQLSGSAVLSSDYTEPSGNLATGRMVIPAGTNTVTLRLHLRGDVEVEGNEALVVTAMPPRRFSREVMNEGEPNAVTFHHPGWDLRPYGRESAWFMTDPLFAVSAQSTAKLTLLDLTPPDLPRLSIQAGATQPQEHPLVTGEFRITRQGNTNAALQIHLSLSGLASNGVDFVRVPDMLTMPAAVTEFSIFIVPFDDGLSEREEYVLCELVVPPDLSYAIGQGWAELHIKDSDLVAHRLEFGEQFGGTKVLNVFGEEGRTVVVESSTNLLHWQPVATNILILNPTTISIEQFWEQSRFYKTRLLPP